MQINIKSHNTGRYPTWFKLRAPVGFQQAVAAAAAQRHTSVSEFVRQLVLGQLRKDGIRLLRNGSVEHLDTGTTARGRP